MWWIRYKETKKPFVFTTRVGYAGPGGERVVSERGRMIRNMPHGCRRKVSPEDKNNYGMLLAAGDIKRIPTPAKTCSKCGACGKYAPGYSDRGRIVSALTTSGIMREGEGTKFSDLEFINESGKTMDEMVLFPVSLGYCLRHRKDKWLWMNPGTDKVWYRRASDIEGAWRRNEKRLAHNEGRDQRRKFRQQGLVMCAGDDQGTIREMPNYE
jgi:hypothetical protein